MNELCGLPCIRDRIFGVADRETRGALASALANLAAAVEDQRREHGLKMLETLRALASSAGLDDVVEALGEVEDRLCQ